MQQLLPLHPLSLRIIEHEYAHLIDDEGVLHLTKKHLLFFSTSISYRLRGKRWLQKRLPAAIHVNINTKIKDPASTGYVIYKMHIQQIMQQVYAMCTVRNNAMANIKQICSMYKIEDEHFDLDSMARAWRRYVQDKALPKVKDNIRHEGRQKRLSYGDICYTYLSYSLQDCDSCINTIIKEDLQRYCTARRLFSETLYNGLRAYIYYRYGKLSQKQIGKTVGVSRTTVRDRIASIHQLAMYDKDLQNIIERTFKGLYASIKAD